MHLILRRDTPTGPQVLLSRRAGDVYASGMWHLPSGHLDGPHEDVITALIREAREETGVIIEPGDVRAAVTVHHRAPGGAARVGFFFEVRHWSGTPAVREPEVCDAMGWFGLEDLPTPMVAYCRAGLDAYRHATPVAVHFQHPEDPIAHQDQTSRLHLIPAVTAPPADNQPSDGVRNFAEKAVGRITSWADTSWARAGSRVWRAEGAHGGTWYVKVHLNDRFHGREVWAYRTWVPRLGAAAPRLLAVEEELRAVVVTAVPGRPLHGAVHPPARQRRLFERIGALASAIHHSAPPAYATDDAPWAVGKLERHLDAARPHLHPGDEEFVRRIAARAKDLPGLESVPTHGDFQLRNLLYDGDDILTVIDFERSETSPAVRDIIRLSDAWHGRSDLRDAFFTGYGRELTDAEEEHLLVGSVLDALSGIQFGTANGDPELIERAHRTFAYLRAKHRP